MVWQISELETDTVESSDEDTDYIEDTYVSFDEVLSTAKILEPDLPLLVYWMKLGRGRPTTKSVKPS